MNQFDLQLFAEGAGEGAATATAAVAAAAQAEGKAQQVVYGKQEEGTGEALESAAPPAESVVEPPKVVTAEERKTAFQSLIEGEYKSEFQERMQQAIGDRLEKSKGVEKQAKQLQPLLELLGKKYGVEGADPAAIADALAADDDFFAEAAGDLGMNIKQYRMMREIQMENEALKESQRESEQERQSKERFAAVLREAETVKAQFSGFDLRAEMGNPQFMSMISKGIPVEHAYKLLHMDELMTGAMQATANAVSEQVAQNIRTRQARPTETGLSGQPGVLVKNDVSKLTSKDRQEIARRAAMGEEIRF